MTDHGTSFAIGDPVAAGHIGVASKRSSVLLRSGQDVVDVWRVASTFHNLTILVECSFLIDLIVRTVEVIDVSGDLHALGIAPGPRPNAITRVDGCRAAGRASAQISTPGAITEARGLR